MFPATLRRLTLPALFAAVVVLPLLAGAGREAIAAPVSQASCAEQAATVEQVVAREQTEQMAGEGDGLPVEEIVAMLRACWEEFELQLPRAEEDCEAYKELAPRVLGWSRQVSLLSPDAEFAAEQEYVMSWVVRSLVNCFNEAFDKCVDQREPDQVFEMRRIERQLALVSAEGEIDQSKYEKCLRFEVSFETTLEFSQPAANHHITLQIRTAVPVQGDYLFDLTGGERPLEYVRFTVQHRPAGNCTPLTPTSFQGTAPFRVLSLRFIRPEPAAGETNPPATDLALSFDPGDTLERQSATCPVGPDGPCVPAAPIVSEYGTVSCVKSGSTAEINSEGRQYRNEFDFHHADERDGGGFTIRGWTMSSGRVLARKTYQRSQPWADGLVTRTENTAFELRHTPQR